MCCLQDVPDLPGFLQPVRAHYVFLSGGLSSVYEPQESAAISNWQRPGKTKAWTILVEYLIEYHSSALIELDRRRQQSERATQMLFLFHARTIRSRLRQTLHEAVRRRMFTIKTKNSCGVSKAVNLRTFSAPRFSQTLQKWSQNIPNMSAAILNLQPVHMIHFYIHN